MKTILMGKRGTVVIPAKIRRELNLDEGSVIQVEKRNNRIIMSPAAKQAPEVEIYTPERLAEFFLNNVLTKEGYLEARKDVQAMGIDPDSIDHFRWPE
jgi:AbrB family looped-hinge helix DNA binding protein